MNNQNTQDTQKIANQLVAGSLEKRVQRQVRRQQVREATEQPALGASGGLIKPLGGNPIRPRGRTSTGSIGVGDPANSPGMATTMPSLDAQRRGIDLSLQRLGNNLGKVALERGFQWADGIDPNDIQGDGSNEVQPARYPYDLAWDETNSLLWYWLPSTASTPGEWVEMAMGGSPVIYGLGDPNSYGDLSDRIPWQAGGIYYDLVNARAFIASPATDRYGDPASDTDKFWMPTGAKTASEWEPLDIYYVGDFWQADQVSSSTESGGMLYRLNENGDWDQQYYCGDCEPDDTPPTMCYILKYTTTPGSSDFNWFRAYYDCDNPPPIGSDFWEVDAGGS